MMRRCSLQILLLFAFGVWAWTAEAQDGNVNPECRPSELQHPRIEPTPTSIKVTWRRFEPRPECLMNGAEYSVHINWTTGQGQEHREEISVHGDEFVIRDLSPYESVDINLSLRYKDKAGNEHLGNVTDFQTRAKESYPSMPRNFRVTEIREDGTLLQWEQPEEPRGPIDGYEYRICSVESCTDMPYIECAGATETRRLEFLAKDLEPLHLYWVWLAAFNQDYVANKRLTGGYAHLCFKALAHALEPVRDMHANCTTPNAIDITWKLPSNPEDIPEGYRMEVYRIGDTGYEKDDKASREVDIKASCHGENCASTVQGLKGAVHHSVELFPHYKDAGPFGTTVGSDGCLVRPAPPTRDIKLVNDPALNKTEQAFEVPSDMFSYITNTVESTLWIVAQDTEIGSCEQPVSWADAISHDPIKCYAISDRDKDDSPLCKTRCVLGNQEPGDCLVLHCNGPLKVGVTYGLKVRAYYSGDHYIDSKPVFFTAGTPVSGSDCSTRSIFSLIAGLIIATAILERTSSAV